MTRMNRFATLTFADWTSASVRLEAVMAHTFARYFMTSSPIGGDEIFLIFIIVILVAGIVIDCGQIGLLNGGLIHRLQIVKIFFWKFAAFA